MLDSSVPLWEAREVRIVKLSGFRPLQAEISAETRIHIILPTVLSISGISCSTPSSSIMRNVSNRPPS